LGWLDVRLHVLCFTPTDDGLRVISLRKANARELRRYEKTPPLTDADGEVRELTAADFALFRPAHEVLPPSLLNKRGIRAGIGAGPCSRGVTPSAQHLDRAAIGPQRAIRRPQLDGFDLGLRHQQAIKRIAVMPRQVSDLQNVLRLDRQLGERL
jgi:hypothetical protein